MNKIFVIDTCEDCPYYDHYYYSYSDECTLLNERGKNEFNLNRKCKGAIQDDCPLEDTSRDSTSSILGNTVGRN